MADSGKQKAEDKKGKVTIVLSTLPLQEKSTEQDPFPTGDSLNGHSSKNSAPCQSQGSSMNQKLFPTFNRSPSGVEIIQSAEVVNVGQNYVSGWATILQVEQGLLFDNNDGNIQRAIDLTQLNSSPMLEQNVLAELVPEIQTTLEQTIHPSTSKQSNAVATDFLRGRSGPTCETALETLENTENRNPHLFQASCSACSSNSNMQREALNNQYCNSPSHLAHQRPTSSKLPAKKIHLDYSCNNSNDALSYVADEMLHDFEGSNIIMAEQQPIQETAWREAPKTDGDSESNDPSHSLSPEGTPDIIADLSAELQARVAAEVEQYTSSVRQIFFDSLDPCSTQNQTHWNDVENEVCQYRYLLKLHQEAAKITQLILRGPSSVGHEISTRQQPPSGDLFTSNGH